MRVAVKYSFLLLSMLTILAINSNKEVRAATLEEYGLEEIADKMREVVLNSRESIDIEVDNVEVSKDILSTIYGMIFNPADYNNYSKTNLMNSGQYSYKLSASGVYYISGMDTVESLNETDRKGTVLRLSKCKQIENIEEAVRDGIECIKYNDDWGQLKKITEVNKYICDYYSYGDSSSDDNLMVCGEYSELFKAFMDVAGIECRVVYGCANGLEGKWHAWNIVRISGIKSGL